MQTATDFKDYYDTLGVSKIATPTVAARFRAEFGRSFYGIRYGSENCSIKGAAGSVSISS
jgi:hypothetical protein